MGGRSRKGVGKTTRLDWQLLPFMNNRSNNILTAHTVNHEGLVHNPDPPSKRAKDLVVLE
jgi:hypothetical protein